MFRALKIVLQNPPKHDDTYQKNDSCRHTPPRGLSPGKPLIMPPGMPVPIRYPTSYALGRYSEPQRQRPSHLPALRLRLRIIM